VDAACKDKPYILMKLFLDFLPKSLVNLVL
jgi:hypothetical protein